METERLILRPFRETDLASFRDLIRDKMRSEYANYDDQFPTDDDSLAGILRYFAGSDEFFAVTQRPDGRLIGYASLNRAEDGARNLGYCILSSCRGQGYGFEAAAACAAYARDALGAARLVSGTALANTPSVRILEKLGFRETGRGEGNFSGVRFEAASYELYLEGTNMTETTMQIPEAAQKALEQRFGHDCIIAVATVDNGAPVVRNVDAVYRDGSFYVVTYTLSGKMQQIAKNPAVAVCGEWFTARGTGENLGWVCAPENKETADMLRKAFAAWYGEGHVDESDENTCILRIRLSDGLMMENGVGYELHFNGEKK